MAAHVRVRAAHVADDEILVREVLLEPGDVDDRVHSAATIPASAAIAGRSSSRAEPGAERGVRLEVDAEHVARAHDPRDEGDVGMRVLRAAEVRLLGQHRVEPAQLPVELLESFAAAERVVRIGELVVAEDQAADVGAVGGIGGKQRRLGDSARRGTP